MHYSKQVFETINYMNERLTEDLSLEILAGLVHFSPYHFHRLFLLCTEETPMEYVRRLRLRSASQDLLFSKLSSLEIAAKYRFESPDGFCRAFKKYYGLTPGIYRKLNIKLGQSLPKKGFPLFGNEYPNTKIIEEVQKIMYDMKIYEKLACSFEEKKEAMITLDKVLQLSKKARKSGLLSLETEIDEVQSEMFKKSIQLLIDGIEPETLKEILLTFALCGNQSGKELLIKILIIEGILAIQQGINPSILREKLSSYFGEDFIGEINKYFSLDSESQLNKVETYINQNRDKATLSKYTSLLEEPFTRMDKRSLQRLLRDIDTVTLINSISGSSGKIQEKVLTNVSRKLAVLLVEELEGNKTIIFTEITASQKRVLEVMNDLRNLGDIVI